MTTFAATSQRQQAAAPTVVCVLGRQLQNETLRGRAAILEVRLLLRETRKKACAERKDMTGFEGVRARISKDWGDSS
jgi:hypothetical protein